jgi:hypothetical protein
MDGEIKHGWGDKTHMGYKTLMREYNKDGEIRHEWGDKCTCARIQ